MKDRFQRFARVTANAAGSPVAFALALAVTVLWALTGPYFHFSDTWQLVINTGTTIATFLIVFLIQHTQNHDTQVIHLKLDELIRAVSTARTELVNLESLPEHELDTLQKEFETLRAEANSQVERISSARRKTAQVNPDGQEARGPT